MWTAVLGCGSSGSPASSAPDGGDASLPPAEGGAADASDAGDSSAWMDAPSLDGEPPADSSSDAVIPDAPTSDAPYTCTGQGGASCNDLQPQGPVIVSTCASGAAPTPQGGIIALGTYLLDGMTYYGTCPTSPLTGRYTWLLCPGGWTTAQEVPVVVGGVDAGSVVLRDTAEASVMMSTVTLTPTCASSGHLDPPMTWGYDATPGHLTLYVALSGGGVRGDSYTQQ